MAPKKTDNNSTSDPKKVGRTRLVRAKTNLKTPTVIKVKIPTLQSSGTNGMPKLTNKQLIVQRKIELANEVARAQLVKDEPVEIVPEVKVTKRRGRHTKKSECLNDDPEDSEAAVEIAPPKKRGRVLKKMDAEKKGPTKRSADSTVRRQRADTKKAKQPTSNNKVNVERPPMCIGTRNLRKKKIPGKVLNDIQIMSSLLEHKLAENIANDDVKNNMAGSQCADASTMTLLPINSRKTSTSSVLSWTRDISNSSTTTCLTVSSNDFVRIDEKLPVLLLNDINEKLNIKKNTRSSSSSSTSSSSSDETVTDIAEMKVNTPNLSTSSVSLTKSDDENENSDNISKIGKALDKLSSKLKNFDLEIVSWIGYENEGVDSEEGKEAQRFHDRLFRVLKNESEVISQCQKLKSLLCDDADCKTQDGDLCVNRDEIDFVKPISVVGKAEAQDTVLNKRLDCKENCVKFETKVTQDKTDHTDKLSTVDAPFDQNYDDDDALSLFAESITGIESSRMQSSVPSTSNVSVSDTEEYIPKPKEVWKLPESYTYRPTKIVDNEQCADENSKKRAVCEKQSADSTSIFRRTNSANVQAESLEDQNIIEANNVAVNTHNGIFFEANRPYLMASRFKSINAVKSLLFRGFCFFNLLSSCKNEVCHFPHTMPDVSEIKSKVAKLNEAFFIQEYMLIRNWPNLRRQFGICFVEECARRDLSRILVEMAIDFILKANANCKEDARLQIEVAELTLMHLNGVYLMEFEDLLKYQITPQTLLCEVFMKTIADTQNFSRFKIVFINLTHFIINAGRTFSLEVAERILERVSILPSEEPLARATMFILKHTDANIFQNKMMAQFELQLISLKIELHREFLLLKKQANFGRPALRSPYPLSPQLNLEIDPIKAINPAQTSRGKRYTSPDTTKLDTVNKPTAEPVINRTIGLNNTRFNINLPKIFSINIPQSFNNQSSPSSSNENDNGVVNIIMQRNWQNNRQFGATQGRGGRMVRPVVRPAMRPPANMRVSQRQVTYGGSPSVCT